MTRTRCAAAGCGNSSYNSKLTFFKLPKKPEKFARWVRLIGRPDLINKISGHYFLCQSHFRRDDINSSGTKNYLHKKVNPSLNLLAESDPNNRIDYRFHHKSTQYDSKYLLPDTSNPQLKSRVNIREHLRKNRRSQKHAFDKLCDLNLPKEVARIVKMQAAFKLQFHRDSFNKKQYFYLRLFHANPKTYAALRQTLQLPTRKTLAALYTPHIMTNHASLMRLLQMKVDCISEKEKNCSVLIHAVPVKPNLFYNIGQDKIHGFQDIYGTQRPQLARFAVVIMARGIFDDWSLPISYALFSKRDHEDIASWFDTVLTRMFEIGLNVRLCISNFHSDTLPKRVKEVPVDKPVFFHNGRQVYFMYDPGYLMFKIRHVLMEFDLQFQQLEAKWKHILQFYESDSKKLYRLAPALTDYHIASGSQKRNLTKELLSETVAAGISAYVDFGQIDESARGVVKLISILSKLIDYMASSTMGENPECYGNQSNIITETISLFRELKVFKDGEDVSAKMMFIREFKLTFKSVLLLFDDLRRDGYAQLPMKYLNMDVLTGLMTKLKKSERGLKRPTAWELVRAYGNKLLFSLLKPSKIEKQNDDVSQYISSFYQPDTTANGVHTTKAKAERNVVAGVRRSDYSDLSLPAKHQFMYMCAFVLMKTLKRHQDCAPAVVYGMFDESQAFSIYQEYHKATCSKLPMIPRDSLIDYLQKVESQIQRFFKSIFLRDNIGSLSIIRRIKACTDNISFESPCECFPVLFLRELYIRIRIFHLLAMNNKKFKHCLQDKPVFTFQYLS